MKYLKKDNNFLIYNRQTFGKWLLFIFLIIFIVVIGRFYYVITKGRVQNVDLASQARKIYINNKTVYAKRGDILDRKGNPIAQDNDTYSLYAILNKQQVGVHNKPLYVTNKDRVAYVLSKYLPISQDKVLKILNHNKKAFQVEFGKAGKNISILTREKIESKHLNGINFLSHKNRFYPNGEFASNFIGITDQNDNKNYLKGTMGLEGSFNKKLTGRNGERSIKKDKFGYQLPGSRTTFPAVNGNILYTTLDSRLQNILETQISKVEREVHAKRIVATVMNARNGAILATSQRPNFNLKSNKVGTSRDWNNEIVQSSYEPGSVMKVFATSSAIDCNAFNGNEQYMSGKYYIDGKKITDWNGTGWGEINYAKGFALSSNVAMAHLEQKMGSRTWKNYINKFHLLNSTHSGLLGELPGRIAFDYPFERANTAFGQSISVTHMSVLQALTAIANDGKMIKPQFVEKIKDPNNNKIIYRMHSKTVGHPIKASSAEKVRKLMQDVVYKPYGVGRAYQIPGYRIAAKTGTAQIANPDGSGYMYGADTYLYSVAGMAPAKNPKYIVYVTMRQPKISDHKISGQFLSKIFNPVMKQALGLND